MKIYPGVTPSSVVLTNKRGGYRSGRDLNCSKLVSVVGSSISSCAAAEVTRASQKLARMNDDNIDGGVYEMQVAVIKARASCEKQSEHLGE